MISQDIKERFFFAGTGQAIEFLKRLETDAELALKCSRTDLQGRMELAESLNYDFTEENMRVAIRIWDYSGGWRQWLTLGRIDEGVEDLPGLDSHYLITPEQKEIYQQDGHILLREIMSEQEMAQYRPAIRRAVNAFCPSTNASRELESQAYKESGFISAFNLRQHDKAVMQLALAKRFGRIAADLMGVDAVRIYLDEAFYKEPGGGKTQWHQDRTYFPPNTDQLMTMWIPMVDITETMGGLRFASGSHKHGSLGYWPIVESSSKHFEQYIQDQGLSVTEPVALRAGDATFHNGWTLHSAKGNEGNRTREAFTVVYYPDGTILPEPENRYQSRAIELGYPGKKPGEPAVSPIHPIVFSRDSK